MYDGQDILVTEMNNQGEGKEESGRLTYGCAEEEVKVGEIGFTKVAAVLHSFACVFASDSLSDSLCLTGYSDPLTVTQSPSVLVITP